MTEAIESCVHCGFCLPTCPTYVVLGEEMNSPRGRILLMKETLEGTLNLEEALPYLDPCLGCVACVTACPSGVQYGELITAFRMEAEPKRERTLIDKALRKVILETLPYPWRFRMAASLGQLAKPFQGVFTGRLGDMLGLLPNKVPKAQPLPEVYPAEGQRRAKSGPASRVCAAGSCSRYQLGHPAGVG